LGGFCAPLDQNSQKTLIKTANLENKWSFLSIYDCIRISLAFAFGVGLTWLLIVQCFPRFIAHSTTFSAIISLGALSFLVLLGNISAMSSTIKYTIGFLLLGFAILFSFFLCFYRLRNKLVGIFLDWSTRFMK
jgi:hypothetical protein